MSATLQHLQIVKNFHYDTYLHSIRVAMLAHKIGGAIGLNWRELDQLTLSALLHDVGKVKLSLKILNKPDKLEPEEWDKIKEHPQLGIEVLRANNYFLSEDIMNGIYSHHEYFNGKGYPQGLKGESINIFARVIAVADAIDAMTTKRLYRPHERTLKDALQEVMNCAGTQFDPYICHKIPVISRDNIG